jgi:hypothetical protein
MAKGLFTAGAVVLTKSPVEVEELEQVLAGYEIARRFDDDKPTRRCTGRL